MRDGTPIDVNGLLTRARCANLAGHTPGAAPTNGGSAIVAALEAAWADIRERHPELPNVQMITGSGLNGYGLVWGHFARDRWEDALSHGRRPEVFIGGERLATGAVLTLQTMLHEAAHALAFVRGEKDTSRQHRYHNRVFRRIAGELGLEYTKTAPCSSLGFSEVTITSDCQASYSATIAALTSAITLHIPSALLGLLGGPGGLPGGHGGKLPGGGRGKGTGGAQRLKATCECQPERVIYVSRSTYDFAGIACEACQGEFLVAEDKRS